jgi:hypothetical protein
MFSSSSFIVLGFTVKPLIHFEFIFTCGEIEIQSYSPMYGYPVFPAPLLKKASLPNFTCQNCLTIKYVDLLEWNSLSNLDIVPCSPVNYESACCLTRPVQSTMIETKTFETEQLLDHNNPEIPKGRIYEVFLVGKLGNSLIRTLMWKNPSVYYFMWQLALPCGKLILIFCFL